MLGHHHQGFYSLLEIKRKTLAWDHICWNRIVMQFQQKCFNVKLVAESDWKFGQKWKEKQVFANLVLRADRLVENIHLGCYQSPGRDQQTADFTLVPLNYIYSLSTS